MSKPAPAAGSTKKRKGAPGAEEKTSAFEYQDPAPAKKGTAAYFFFQQDYILQNRKTSAADKLNKADSDKLKKEAGEAWKKMPGAAQAPFVDKAKNATAEAERKYALWQRKLQRQCLIICQEEDDRGTPHLLPSGKYDYDKMKELMQGEGWLVTAHLNVKTKDQMEGIFENFLAGQSSIGNG